MEQERRVYRKGTCVYCNEYKYIAAHGLCRACNSRQRKNGQLEKIQKRNTCIVDGCGHFVVGQGYCEMHYSRFLRHGDPLYDGRPKDWGCKANHPLYGSWSTMRRANFKGKVCDIWLNDFWSYVKDVGERPSKNHFIRLIDEGGIYDKSNVEWKEKLIEKGNTESDKEYKAIYARAYRAANPDKMRNSTLKKSFGIGLVDYQKMYDNQNGCCAICGGYETVINPAHKHGDTQPLSVDHNHETGKIRGLLCSSCNTSLGGFKDDIQLLQNAIQYLQSHEEQS